MVTAYALAFGSLLLLGGKLSDLLGRKVTFLVGLIGFAAASAVGGAAVSFGMLVAARACQGAFGALLAPSALSLLTVTFTDPEERGKAFAVYGAVAGAGGAVGLPSLVIGLALGLVFAPVFNTGTFGVAPRDAGVASATVNTGQQLGGSIGTSLLNTIFASAVASYIAARLSPATAAGDRPSPQLSGLALIHGYTVAFWVSAAIFAGGALIAVALFRTGPLTPPGEQAAAQHPGAGCRGTRVRGRQHARAGAAAPRRDDVGGEPRRAVGYEVWGAGRWLLFAAVAGPGVVGAVEALEDVGGLFGGHARPLVGDGELDAAADRGHGDGRR